MARIFKAGTNAGLQEELIRRVSIDDLATIQSQQKYDQWLTAIVRNDCWAAYSRNGLRLRRNAPNLR